MTAPRLLLVVLSLSAILQGCDDPKTIRDVQLTDAVDVADVSSARDAEGVDAARDVSSVMVDAVDVAVVNDARADVPEDAVVSDAADVSVDVTANDAPSPDGGDSATEDGRD